LNTYSFSGKKRIRARAMKSIRVLTDKDVRKLERYVKKVAQAKFRHTGLPFVTVKFAQTLDGKIASLTGDSRWISGPSSLRFAHQLRSWHDAVLVGVNTIIRDNPQLTVRLVPGRNPQKIIVDSRLRTPLSAKVLRGKAALSTNIATTRLSDSEEAKRYESRGAEVWLIKEDRHHRVDLPSLLREMGRRSIHSVLVEGGSEIISAFLRGKLVDHLVVVTAPKILGRGVNWFNPSGSYEFKKLTLLALHGFFRSGDDVILEAFLRK
jgi:diaminohydroxyphosphoribosylaminopyrimidine deaminase/5-amino-6-(5-phosphoribosylamino)uracil reductase